MDKVKRFVGRFAEPVVLFAVFWAAQLPLRDPDIWFHIKAGEYFTSHGLTFVEPFSFAAAGREWIAFEWLYQIIVYQLSRIGLFIIPPFTSLFVVAMAWIFLKTLKDIFDVPLGTRLITFFLFFALGYEFMTSRPHTIAYTFLFFELMLVFFRLFKGKRHLYILPIVTLIWTNIHSTGFLSWGMLAAYSLVVWISYLITKKKSYLPILKDFLIVAVLCAAATLLPPKGIGDYRLLWDFFLDRKFLADFIIEWGPPEQDAYIGFIIYLFLFAGAILGTVWIAIRTRRWVEYLWTAPLLVIAFMGSTASRNIYLGFFASIFLLGWIIARVGATPSRTTRVLFGTLAIVTIAVSLWLFHLKYTYLRTQRLQYPVGAAEFAKRYLKGRMFNEYTTGGYMLYSVYPTLQIFLDGRAEVFHRHEMRDYIMLAGNKRLPDPEYKVFLDSFFDKYAFDFVIIGIQKHAVMRRIGTLLTRDPNWALLYWDDYSEVFVRKNGRNDEMIRRLEAKAATPYSREPFDKTQIEQALFEYERMNEIVPSARTSNALGYILELQGDFKKAKDRFIEAVGDDPTFESPYMNLAELSARDGDTPTAIRLYQKALSLASDRGLIYVRLGQLMLQESPNNKDEVRKLWEKGIEKTVDSDARDKLKELLLAI